MLTRRQLGLTAAVLAICLCAMNLAVGYLSRNSVPRRVMRHARESQPARLVAIGNSLMVAGFDEAVFDASAGLAAPQGAANLGLGASYPVQQLLLWRYAWSQGIRPSILVYGFYDLQLTQDVRFSAADLLGNNALLYYLEPGYARQFYSMPAHDSVMFDAMHSVPMYADRGAIWAKVEILRRRMAQQGMLHEATNQFGRAADFSLLEAPDSETFRRDCEAALQQPLAPPVAELLREAHDEGVKIVVVEMPMRSAHRRLFYDLPAWGEYIAHARELMAPYDVTFVDAHDWISDDTLFADPLHLSDKGAAILSERLGKLLGPTVDAGEATDRRASTGARSGHSN